MSKSPGPLRALWLLLAVVLGVLPMASAVADDSNFRIWGSRSFSGQIQPGDVVVEVAAGNFHTVALLEDGSIRCWGWNDSGQCDVPSGVGEPGNLVTAVAGGYGHTVALLGREVPPVPGDFNGDGVLDGADYIAIREHLGVCAADIDANGVVDGVDLSFVLGSWGLCTTSP
jgi:hypothetical protein